MMEDERTRRALDAALATFLRYGFRRATMGDIGAAAAMSRPALYLIFANKEAAFTAVLGDMGDRALADIRAALPDLPDRRARLRYALERWCVAGYALANSSPDARDLVEGTQEAGRAVMARVFAELEHIIVDIFGQGQGADPRVLASLLTAAARGYKDARPSVEAYRAQLHAAIDAVLLAHGA